MILACASNRAAQWTLDFKSFPFINHTRTNSFARRTVHKSVFMHKSHTIDNIARLDTQ